MIRPTFTLRRENREKFSVKRIFQGLRGHMPMEKVPSFATRIDFLNNSSKKIIFFKKGTCVYLVKIINTS